MLKMIKTGWGRGTNGAKESDDDAVCYAEEKEITQEHIQQGL